ncbi:MAG: glycoside hydrolase family protein [Candidatus Bathyarchaeota archaeon B26-2]|nr:MAG: glycoside hydrolase family protein [Candidatus Bathyarchaeota archaeon B26-2]
MNAPRIVIVGAGSHFTLGLFGDFFRVDDLWGSELVLMDINEERLKVMNRIVSNIVKEKEVDLEVVATTSLEEALETADFVILTIRVGGLEAFKEILEVPLKLGVVEVVGDTVGPSGLLKGLLEIPAIFDVAYRLKDIAPYAVMINFTNPMTAICRAVRKATNLEILGLCHGFNHIRRLASNILTSKERSCSIERLEIAAVGINHLTWTLDIKYESESVYEEFLSRLFMEEFESVITKHPYMIGRELCKVFNVPPTLSDRHTSEFFHYLYEWMEDPKYGPILKGKSGYIDYDLRTLRKDAVKREEDRMKGLQRMAEGKEEARIVPSGEYALDIISAIVNERTITLQAVNIPNDGVIEGVNPDHIVEVPAEMSKHGPSPVGRFRVPDAVLSILNQHLQKFEILVDGILERDKGLITQAIALDPLTPSPEKAEKILDTFIERHPVEWLKET